jgi:hypothetical protein
MDTAREPVQQLQEIVLLRFAKKPPQPIQPTMLAINIKLAANPLDRVASKIWHHVQLTQEMSPVVLQGLDQTVIVHGLVEPIVLQEHVLEQLQHSTPTLIAQNG